eukprot:6254222-Alexandrium_andersonii.AAC.1
MILQSSSWMHMCVSGWSGQKDVSKDALLYTEMCPCMHCERLHVACMAEPSAMIAHATISAPQAWPLAAASSLQ